MNIDEKEYHRIVLLNSYEDLEAIRNNIEDLINNPKISYDDKIDLENVQFMIEEAMFVVEEELDETDIDNIDNWRN